MDFGARLKTFRLSRNLTQAKFAANIGVSELTIRNWEGNKKKPSLDALLAISQELGVSIDLLMGIRRADMLGIPSSLEPPESALLKRYRKLDEYGRKTVNAVCSLEYERVLSEENALYDSSAAELHAKKSSERFIPRYTTPAAAGVSVPLDGVDFEMMLVNDSVPPRADYAVNIQGDSMSPYICDGDMVYVQKDVEPSAGDVGIWCVDGAMYCKQYYTDKNQNLYLISANEDMQSTNVFVAADSNSTVKFCGKVLLHKRIGLPKYFVEK